MICTYCERVIQPNDHFIGGCDEFFCSSICFDKYYEIQRGIIQHGIILEQAAAQRKIDARDSLERNISGLIDYFTFFKTHPITTDIFPEVRDTYNRALEYTTSDCDFAIKSKILILKDVLSQIQSNYDNGKQLYQPIQDKLDREDEIARLKKELQHKNDLLNNPQEVGPYVHEVYGLHGGINTGIRLVIGKIIFYLQQDIMHIYLPQILNLHTKSRDVTITVALMDNENRDNIKSNKPSYIKKTLETINFTVKPDVEYAYTENNPLKISLPEVDFGTHNIFLKISDAEYCYAWYIFDNSDRYYGEKLSQIKTSRLLKNDIDAIQQKIYELENFDRPQQHFSNTTNIPPSQENTSQANPTPGEDIEQSYSIPAAYLGKEVEFEITTKKICSTCNGAGKIGQGPWAIPCFQCGGNKYLDANKKVTVKIPANIENGQLLRLRGLGYPSLNGGPAGNFYIQVNLT